MTDPQQLRFFLTQEHTCGYLPKNSQSLCLDPKQAIDRNLLGLLTQNGFRRSGQLVYRPHCSSCSACIPVRIPLRDFQHNKGQARTFKRGLQLAVSEHTPSCTDEYYDLYQRYICAHHADGSMYPPSIQQFKDFLTLDLSFTRFFEFRLNGQLMAVAVSDVLPDGLSAVYSFYEPDDKYFSLGRQTVLWQIEHARQLGYPTCTLATGFRDCKKMSYKIDYQPLQAFIDDYWRPLPV